MKEEAMPKPEMTYGTCGGCDAVTQLVRVGEESYYESATAYVCGMCLRESLAVIEAAEKKANDELAALIEKARHMPAMTEDERKEQAASFAYGQIALTKEWAHATRDQLAELRATCRRLAGLT